MVGKKLRKLRQNPRRFAYDALLKRSPRAAARVARRFPELKRPARRRFSVVSAVYNVERYLEDYFRAMEAQTVSLDYIELILVDDGSTDRSAEIIERWRRRYPNSVRYLHKENGGQASARNLGLEHATGEWVTFIDPDDFVHHRYFEAVDHFAHEHRRFKPALLCCKWVFFNEASGEYRDNHPLNYRFDEGSRVIGHRDQALLAPSCATSFYRLDEIRAHGLRFDEQMKPHFEDALFAGRYLLATFRRRVGLVADAVYYYRKRSDGSSTLDTAWADPRRFDLVLERGHRALIAESIARYEMVPLAIQRLLLYDLVWAIRRIVDNDASVWFLDAEQRERFLAHLERIFAHIDSGTIVSFSLAGCWFFHRVGMLGLFRGEPAPYYVAYVRRYDPVKRLVQVAYFVSGEAPLEEVLVDGQEVVPHFAKRRRHSFLGRGFVDERILWVRLERASSELSLRIAGEEARLRVGAEQLTRVSRGAVERALTPAPPERAPIDEALVRLAQSGPVRRRFAGAWMLMDRDTQADDNAEHLYRWIAQHRPDINAFFVLLRSSQDWPRLEAEGFKLVAYGSLEHRLLLLNAAHIASSHPDAFVLHFLDHRKFRDQLTYRFTFLQHGILRDDISAWLNRKRIDRFVTTSPAEHASVAADLTPYKFSPREARMVGLARHDALLTRSEPAQRVILLMPTWRQWLVGATSQRSTAREASPEFFESTYAKAWREVIRSPALRDLARRHGYQIVFFPHANMQLYVDWFDAPPWVEVRTHATDPILHKLFRRASVLVTDYSSVFFEVGLLDKPVLYYQFDYDEMYGGRHPSRPGYFDFERDGFGPVTRDCDALLEELDAILARGAQPAPEYLARMRAALPLRDAQNRARTVAAIEALDAPEPVEDQRDAIRLEMARDATRVAAWELALARWSEVERLGPEAEEVAARLEEARRHARGPADAAQAAD